MRRMYSESQLKRLIEENGTKLYRHDIHFIEKTYMYGIDITLISGRAGVYATIGEALKDNAGVTVAAQVDMGGMHYSGTLSTVGASSKIMAYVTTSASTKRSELTDSVTVFTDTVTPL